MTHQVIGNKAKGDVWAQHTLLSTRMASLRVGVSAPYWFQYCQDGIFDAASPAKVNSPLLFLQPNCFLVNRWKHS